MTSCVSGVVVDPTGMDVLVKFGDSRSNRSRDIRRDIWLPQFVTDERTTPAYTRHQISPKRQSAFCLKTNRDMPFFAISVFFSSKCQDQKVKFPFTVHIC